MKVYTTSICAYCKMVKQYLDNKGISYEVINLDEKPELRQELFELTQAMTVPIVEHNGQYVIGWNPAKLNALL